MSARHILNVSEGEKMQTFDAAHGEFTVTSQGNFIYCDYSQGFNKEGVKAITTEILRVAQPHDQWVLLQRPAPSAGITVDAIPDMYQSYVKLQDAGCLAVGLHDNTIYVRAGKFDKNGPLTIPIVIDKDIPTLVEFLQNTLRQHGL